MSKSHFTARTRLRVRYADTDKMGIVYYGKYFEYFEVARTEMLRGVGVAYADLEAAGYGLPVSKAAAEYFRGAKYDEELEIETRIPLESRAALEIVYRVHAVATGEIIATGSTTLVFISLKTGRPTRPPAAYVSAIKQHAALIETSVD